MRVAEAYIIQVTNIQDRTGLTGTPLGVGLAIKLFIHEIASSTSGQINKPGEYYESTRKTVRTQDITDVNMMHMNRLTSALGQ